MIINVLLLENSSFNNKEMETNAEHGNKINPNVFKS